MIATISNSTYFVHATTLERKLIVQYCCLSQIFKKNFHLLPMLMRSRIFGGNQASCHPVITSLIEKKPMQKVGNN